MKAPQEQQRAALELQRFDLKLSQLHNQIAKLPELQEIKEATLNANSARDLRIAAETELKDVQRELARAEADVEQIVSRIERDERRLNSGEGAPKELEQLQHELGSLAARRAELEEVELSIMMRVDEIKARITELEGREKVAQEQSFDAQVRKENATTSLTAEIAAVERQRSEIASQIGKELLDLYEKVRGDRGIGAAALSQGQCMGCNLTLNATEIARLKTIADDEVVRCEECRCILVRGA